MKVVPINELNCRTIYHFSISINLSISYYYGIRQPLLPEHRLDKYTQSLHMNPCRKCLTEQDLQPPH